MQRLFAMGLMITALLWIGCAPPEGDEATGGSDAVEAEGTAEHEGSGGPGGQSMAASPLGTPKDVVAHQYVLLRAGRYDDLRELFTPDVREQLTDEFLEEVRANAQPVSINQLVDKVLEEEVDGQILVTIKSRDGQTLTRMVRHGSTWQADTVWFKQP